MKQDIYCTRSHSVDCSGQVSATAAAHTQVLTLESTLLLWLVCGCLSLIPGHRHQQVQPRCCNSGVSAVPAAALDRQKGGHRPNPAQGAHADAKAGLQNSYPRAAREASGGLPRLAAWQLARIGE